MYKMQLVRKFLEKEFCSPLSQAVNHLSLGDESSRPGSFCNGKLDSRDTLMTKVILSIFGGNRYSWCSQEVRTMARPLSPLFLCACKGARTVPFRLGIMCCFHLRNVCEDTTNVPASLHHLLLYYCLAIKARLGPKAVQLVRSKQLSSTPLRHNSTHLE